MAPNASPLRQLLRTLGQAPSRILDVGAGRSGGEMTTVPLLDMFPEAVLTALEFDPGRADALRRRFGDRVAVVTGDIVGYVPEAPVDLIVVDLDPSAVPLVFDSLLEPVLLGMTAPGGMIVTNVVLDLINAYHGPEPPFAHREEARLAGFMLRRFGRLSLDGRSIASAFAEHPELEVVATVESSPGQPGNRTGWAALRCHPAAGRWADLPGRTVAGRARLGGRPAGAAPPPGPDLRTMARAGELVVLDLLGDRSRCGPDCPALIRRWSDWPRWHFGQFGPARDPSEVLGDALPTPSPSDSEMVIPPLPLAMLEIPEDMEEYRAGLDKRSRQMLSRVRRAGYEFRAFDYDDHLDDIHLIHTSKEVRGGGPILHHLRQRPQPMPPRETCDRHRVVCLGGFAGDALRAYVELIQINEWATPNNILGHGDALPDGVMNGLIHHVVEWGMATGLVRAVDYDTLVDAAPWHAAFRRSVGFRSRVVAFRVERAAG